RGPAGGGACPRVGRRRAVPVGNPPLYRVPGGAQAARRGRGAVRRRPHGGPLTPRAGDGLRAGQFAIPIVCLIVSGCPSTRSMQWATSAREISQPPPTFCPYAVPQAPVRRLVVSRGGRSTGP